jgi:hypothetical protein
MPSEASGRRIHTDFGARASFALAAKDRISIQVRGWSTATSGRFRVRTTAAESCFRAWDIEVTRAIRVARTVNTIRIDGAYSFSSTSTSSLSSSANCPGKSLRNAFASSR